MNNSININHLSYSSISRYLSCPAMFKFYMTEKKPLPSEIQNAGTKRHNEIEKHLLEGTVSKSNLGGRLKNFCARILGPVTAVEAEFKLDYITFDIIGRIDVYAVRGNQAVIVDFKGYPGSHIDELQLQIYALAVKQKHPEVDVIHCAFAYIPPDYYDLKTYFEDDMAKLSITLSAAIDKIAIEEKFEAVPGPHCSRCDYAELCPAVKNFKIPEKLNSQSISVMANDLYALEALVDKGKAVIKDYLFEHGLESLPISGDSRYYLSTSTALRLGKLKAEKGKAVADSVIELETRNEPIKKKTINELPVTTASTNEAKTLNNIIAFQSDKNERVRMSELVDLLKQAGRLPQDATNAAGSQAVKELIGVPFISATEQQKQDLKARLMSGL